jgi:hypothetical protein
MFGRRWRQLFATNRRVAGFTALAIEFVAERVQFRK